jgi:hypothetical protein
VVSVKVEERKMRMMGSRAWIIFSASEGEAERRRSRRWRRRTPASEGGEEGAGEREGRAVAAELTGAGGEG